jgi:hypothetical protein
LTEDVKTYLTTQILPIYSRISLLIYFYASVVYGHWRDETVDHAVIAAADEIKTDRGIRTAHQLC